jgi:HEPN domain-containing protein
VCLEVGSLRLNLAVTPAQYQALALRHLRESLALLRAKEWAGAYYLCGYVVECYLKAVLLRRRAPVSPSLLYTHALEDLLARVIPVLDPRDGLTLDASPEWSHLTRYSTTRPSPGAVTDAINRAEEVARCLSKYL